MPKLDVFELTFEGMPSDLMKYIKDQMYDCEDCKDTGAIEVMGDGDNFEYDVVGIKRCANPIHWD